jgi:hypothetical protein
LRRHEDHRILYHNHEEFEVGDDSGTPVLYLGVERDLNRLPGFMRSRRPLPFIDRILCRPHQYWVSTLHFDGFDHAIRLDYSFGSHTSF